MAPFADAVGLVDGNADELPVSMDGLESPSKSLRLA